MNRKSDDSGANGKTASLQEEQEIPKINEDDDRVTEIEFEASISPPVALALVQATEAAASVLANDSSTVEGDVQGDGHDYVTGIRLVLAVAALTLSATLIFLDNSILSTVRS